MFKKLNILPMVLLVMALAVVSAKADQAPATDEAICRAVFKAIQSSDAETFSSFLITRENLVRLAASLDESDPKEGSIRAEMSGEFSVEKMTEESLVSFQRILKDAKEAEFDLKEATYEGIITLKTRYEAGNHKCKAIKFKMALAGDTYSIRVSVFQTENSNYVYDALKANKLPNYRFTLTTPTDNPVTVAEGEPLAVVVSFDAYAVNNEGAWIETVFDGQGGGMYYDSSMESPYTEKIPGKVMTKGHHTLEYRLQPSGGDTDHPLATIKLDIEVK